MAKNGYAQYVAMFMRAKTLQRSVLSVRFQATSSS